MLISVIIPIYNVAEYLPRCLDSVLQNTHRDLEVLCVNDGSTDTSGEILMRYAAADSRIHVIDRENGGISAARNDGLKAATGEYITFIDPDDWVHEEFFRVLVDLMEQGSADMSMCDYIATDDEDCLSRPIPDESVSGYLAGILDACQLVKSHQKKNFVWRKLFRRELLTGMEFRHLKVEDVAFNMELVVRYPELRIAYTDRVLYAYYRRPGSLSRALRYSDYYDLSSYLYSMMEEITAPELRQVYARELVKRLLPVRFAYLALSDPEKTDSCSRMMRDACRQIKTGRTGLWLFVHLPWIYRSWMILRDPSMRDYEIRLKKGEYS